MIHMTGVDVTYDRRAFTTPIHSGYMRTDSLTRFIKGASKSIKRERGIILPSTVYESEAKVHLLVLIPDGDEQLERLLEVVAMFEAYFTSTWSPPAHPVDIRFRTIEGYSPKCAKAECQEEPGWLCHTNYKGDFFFCDQHARQEPDFKDPDPTCLVWREMPPVTV